MEFFLELFLEIIFYTYFDFVQGFFEEKRLKPWLKYLLAVICFFISFGAVFLVIIGIVFCVDETLDSTAGTIMLIVGSVVLLIHILLAVFSHAIRAENREEEREEDVPQEKSEERATASAFLSSTAIRRPDILQKYKNPV